MFHTLLALVINLKFSLSLEKFMSSRLEPTILKEKVDNLLPTVHQPDVGIQWKMVPIVEWTATRSANCFCLKINPINTLGHAHRTVEWLRDIEKLKLIARLWSFFLLPPKRLRSTEPMTCVLAIYFRNIPAIQA